jgi:hypothetical protein
MDRWVDGLMGLLTEEALTGGILEKSLCHGMPFASGPVLDAAAASSPPVLLAFAIVVYL